MFCGRVTPAGLQVIKQGETFVGVDLAHRASQCGGIDTAALEGQAPVHFSPGYRQKVIFAGSMIDNPGAPASTPDATVDPGPLTAIRLPRQIFRLFNFGARVNGGSQVLIEVGDAGELRAAQSGA